MVKHSKKSDQKQRKSSESLQTVSLRKQLVYDDHKRWFDLLYT